MSPSISTSSSSPASFSSSSIPAPPNLSSLDISSDGTDDGRKSKMALLWKDSVIVSNFTRSICDMENNKIKKTSTNVTISEYVTIHFGVPLFFCRLGLRFMDFLLRYCFIFRVVSYFFFQDGNIFLFENMWILFRF